jgi:demethylmacrocin O-methyltransferase
MRHGLVAPPAGRILASGARMNICDRLSLILLGLRRQLGADNSGGVIQIENSRGRALDLMLKRCASLAGRIGCNLNLLAALCGTDKYGAHDYTPIYQELMSRLRGQPVRLLEIGVGGFQGGLGGESLLMWAAYFPKGMLYGIDIYDKTSLSRGRIKVLQCSQTDRPRLVEIGEAYGPFDFIIDDGSHLNSHQIESFQILWPFVKDHGAYIIEDVQTSYWPAFGGGHVESREYANSCMSYFKGMVDSVNWPEFLEPAGPRSPIDPTIGRIAFHHNLVVITKESSVRRSNVRLDDERLRKMLMSRKAPDSSNSG